GRRHGGRTGRPRRSGGRRLQPRTDLPPRHGPRVMLSASLYITVCSTRNRVRLRLRRLREPRYLFGAIVGLAYLYFAVLGPRSGPRRGRPGAVRPPIDLPSAWQAVGTSLAGLSALVLALLAWLLPMRS